MDATELVGGDETPLTDTSEDADTADSQPQSEASDSFDGTQASDTGLEIGGADLNAALERSAAIQNTGYVAGDEDVAGLAADQVRDTDERSQSAESSQQDDNPHSERDGESAPEDVVVCEDEMTGKDRNSEFEKAESYFSKSKLDLALQCYLKCVKGIERGSGFLYLPQCLHQIAECYHLKEEDEKAIQFLKAEKIYYETALIDTKQMQEKIEEIAGGDNPVSNELESEILRAVEYENLAKLCLEKHQSQLALEFSGKATKVYQKHYGDDHAATQRCLDLFTSVYAEVGREEYTSKLTEYVDSPAEHQAEAADTSLDNTTARKRRNLKEKSDLKTLGSQDIPLAPQSQQSEPTAAAYPEPSCCCSFTFLWITLVVCSLLALFFFGVVYCKLTPTSSACRSLRINYRALSEYLGFMKYKLSK